MTNLDRINIDQISVEVELRTALKEIVPGAFEGDSLDVEVLKQMLGGKQIESTGRFGLAWPGKAMAIKTSQRSPLGALRPKLGEGIREEATRNLVIDGDNLEVLKLLQKAYLSKIKMIYIDPPYNTGNDFVYDDNFADPIDGYLEQTGQSINGKVLSTNIDRAGARHSGWVSMMYPRLEVARTLLAEDGAIFISIGGNELANLRLLCDQIFHEDNFVTYISRVTKVTSNLGVHVAPSTDYVVVFAKSIDKLAAFHEILGDDYASRFKGSDERGKFNTVGLYQVSLSAGRNQRYWIKCPDGSLAIPPGTSRPAKEDEGALAPIESKVDKGWRWSLDKYWKEKDELLVFKQTTTSPLRAPDGTQSNWNVYSKYYLEDRLDAGVRPRDFMSDATNDLGTKELGELGLREVFDFPKPTILVKKFLNWIQDPSALVLDFFAGSGTTAQAVLEMNEEDGGNRKFILVQLPEVVDEDSAAAKAGFKNIAEITKERVRRVIQKLDGVTKDSLGLDGTRDLDRGFKVFALDHSNFVPWDPTAAADAARLEQQLELAVDNVLHDRSDEDLLAEILLTTGFPLDTAITKVQIAGTPIYQIADPGFLVCLAESVDAGLIKAIAATKPHRVVILDAAFQGNDALKTNAVQAFKDQGVEMFRTA
jgi:adenine-specific DNA-methyltransferase